MTEVDVGKAKRRMVAGEKRNVRGRANGAEHPHTDTHKITPVDEIKQ